MGGLIWLASFPKSGNTWMRVFLHNMLKNPPKPISINEINKFSVGDSHARWFTPLTPKPLPEVSHAELATMREKTHLAIARSQPDSVFVKTHNFMGENYGVPFITMKYTAGAIYIVRNPLDVTLSFADHFGLSIDKVIEIMADDKSYTAMTDTHVSEFHGSWSLNVKSWTQMPNPQLKVVRYEDLLDKPLASFADVCKFLGLKPDKERLKKAIRFSSFKELKKQETTTGFQERSEHSSSFFRVGKKEQWREVLSEEQISTIIDQHREQMQRFRYIPSDFS